MQKKCRWIFAIVALYFNLFSISKVDAIDVAADASVMIDANSGRILYEKNAFLKKPMASTTKIMTAILAIEKGTLRDIVTVSKNAAHIGGTSMDLYVGEKQTLEDLLYGLMLVSANDASIAIAEHIGRSEENYAKMMTKKAHEIGAKNTQFKNPHGLDQEGHYTTAYDLALIGRYAMKNETFRKLVTTKRKVVPDDRHANWDRGLRNKNRLLYEYSGAVGIKTGFTGKAGQCFVGAAQKNGIEVITVVLHDTMSKEAKWIDTKALFDYAFTNFRDVKLFEKDEYIRTVPVKNGVQDTLSLKIDQDVFAMLNKEEEKQIQINLKTPTYIQAPIRMGQKIGMLDVVLKEKLLLEIPLYAEYDIEQKKMMHSVEKLLKSWLNFITQGII